MRIACILTTTSPIGGGRRAFADGHHQQQRSLQRRPPAGSESGDDAASCGVRISRCGPARAAGDSSRPDRAGAGSGGAKHSSKERRPQILGRPEGPRRVRYQRAASPTSRPRAARSSEQETTASTISPPSSATRRTEKPERGCGTTHLEPEGPGLRLVRKTR